MSAGILSQPTGKQCTFGRRERGVEPGGDVLRDRRLRGKDIG